MNKRQELDVMILRAKIKTEESLKQHEQSWNGQEPGVVERVEKEENDATVPGLQ